MSDIKIMVVDDDSNICELLRLYLEKEKFTVVTAADGQQALDLFDKEKPDLMLLDVMMPRLDGWQVCREIRKKSQCPIIMVTAKGELFDRVLGLELGADDYVVKPFEAKEVIARIRAVLRRSGINEQKQSRTVEYEGLSINMETYELKVNGKVVDTPPKEMELIYHLASNPNRVYTRDQLLDTKAKHPDALVVCHPECQEPIRLLADHICSTEKMIPYCRESECSKFIIVTETGILHRLRKLVPGKEFIPMDMGQCSCAECEYMKLNTLEKLRNCLRDMAPEVRVPEELRLRAAAPLERMLELSK